MDNSSNKWLDAQLDKTCIKRSLSTLMCSCDVTNDNYYKLIIIEIPNEFSKNVKSKLKVIKGTSLINEINIPGIPTSMTVLYIDENELPVIAIAVGASILFYKNMKPYNKFTIPNNDVNTLEKDIWHKLINEKTENIPSLINKLKNISFKEISFTSQKLIHLADNECENFIRNFDESNLENLPNITAIASLKKHKQSYKSNDYLIIATDIGDIFILDIKILQIIFKSKVNSFMKNNNIIFISPSGTYDIDYKIIIGTNDNILYILRKNNLEGREIVKLNLPVIGLTILPIDQTIVVVCMSQSLICLSKKGKTLWVVKLPLPAVCMLTVMIPILNVTLICVSMIGGLVQFYLQKNLIDYFKLNTTATAMSFGRLGQEEHVLSMITEDNSLHVKILKRTADFTVNNNNNINNSLITPNNAGILAIPKKSKLFIEQTIREKEHCAEIYHSLQSELWRLRLTTSRSIIDIINSKDSTISDGYGSIPLKLLAVVVGLGPVYRLNLILENLATRKEATGLNILIHGNYKHYIVPKPYINLSTLIPGCVIKCSFKIILQTNDDNSAPMDLNMENAIIRVIVFKTNQTKPLIAASVAMPIVCNDFI